MFLLVDSSLLLDAFHPLLRICLGHGLQMEIFGGREDTEDVCASTLGIFEIRHSRQVREGDLLQESRFGGVFVQGEEIGSKDEVERLPLLPKGVSQSGKSMAGMNQERPTFVLRVRLFTSPLFRTRSKANEPFWLTGENVSRFR